MAMTAQQQPLQAHPHLFSHNNNNNNKRKPKVTCCLPWKLVLLILTCVYISFLSLALDRVREQTHQSHAWQQQQQQQFPEPHSPVVETTLEQDDNAVEKLKDAVQQQKLDDKKPPPQQTAASSDAKPESQVNQNSAVWNIRSGRHRVKTSPSNGEIAKPNNTTVSGSPDAPHKKAAIPRHGTSQTRTDDRAKTTAVIDLKNVLADLVTGDEIAHASSWLEVPPQAQLQVGTVDAKHHTRLVAMETKVGNMVDQQPKLISCRRPRPATPSDTGTEDTFAAHFNYYCLNSAKKEKYYYHNPHLRVARIVCGQIIGPQETISLPKLCSEPAARLFSVIPQPTDQRHRLPPVVAEFRNGKGTPVDFDQCNVYCQTTGSFSIVTERKIRGPNWTITMSMEGPQYYPKLEIDPQAWRQGRFYSTTSFDSDIPLPYYSRAEYKLWDGSPPVNYSEAIRGGAFLARNCNSKNNREQVIRELQQYASDKFRVDSISSCLHNADPPEGADPRDKTALMRHYLFYFAFENQNVKDYITEKLWGPYVAGTVPVYLGAPNVQEHAPPHSLIHVQAFASNKELFQYLETVAQNQTLYEEYQAWRFRPRPAFDEKMNLTATHGTCRTCRWAYARLYGLGWNHDQQRVEDLRIPNSRQACLTPSGGGRVLQHPVVEQWTMASETSNQLDRQPLLASEFQPKGRRREEQSKDLTCLRGTLAQDSTVFSTAANGDAPAAKILRVVRQVDGVIDINIFAMGNSSVVSGIEMHLETKLSRDAVKLKEMGPAHVRLQDQQSRMTVVAWPFQVELKQVVDRPHVLSVPMDSLPMRLRIISEDVNLFHKGADKEENYFGATMIADFYNPVEVFTVL